MDEGFVSVKKVAADRRPPSARVQAKADGVFGVEETLEVRSVRPQPVQGEVVESRVSARLERRPDLPLPERRPDQNRSLVSEASADPVSPLARGKGGDPVPYPEPRPDFVRGWE